MYNGFDGKGFMSRKTDEEIRRSYTPELWAFLKKHVMKNFRRLPPEPLFVQPKESHKREYVKSSVDNIDINIAYLETEFGGQGLGRQMPETQGFSYGWAGGGGWGSWISARERFEECKIMVSYFVRCGDFVKIGRTNRVGQRMGALQISNPEPLELLLCLPNRVGFREEDLHYRFRNQRKEGEWFSYDGDLFWFVREKVSLCKKPMDLSLVPTAWDLKQAGCGDGT